MYSSFHSTSSNLASAIRSDIFSLLGNSGKTSFTSETVEFSFSFSFFFSQSLHRIFDRIEKYAYRKPLTYLAICFTTLMISPSETSFANEITEPSTQKTFIVTAYYSPLPWQTEYYRWSYEADIRLNGRGTNGASGTPVFAGMIAAPKSYDYGTQIFFEGLGLGTVADRGGAIVDAYVRWQAYDRIDIWVWYGDEWLRRARAWWIRQVQWTIVNNDTRDAINIAGILDGSVNLSQYPKPGGSTSIGWLSSDVISAFRDLGYSLSGNDTKAMITEFQIEHDIINSKSDDGAGNYGPKTRAALAKLHAEFQAKRDKELEEIKAARTLLLTDHDAWEKKYKQAESQVIEFGQPQLKEKWDGIKLLQSFLQSGKHYVGNPDGQMTPRTLVAIRKYQKSKNIKATGKLDENTRIAMIEDIARSL